MELDERDTFKRLGGKKLREFPGGIASFSLPAIVSLGGAELAPESKGITLRGR